MKLCGEYSNVQTLLLILLQWTIDHAVTVKPKGDESKHLSVLTDMLASIELDSNAADLVSRYPTFREVSVMIYLLRYRYLNLLVDIPVLLDKLNTLAYLSNLYAFFSLCSN